MSQHGLRQIFNNELKRRPNILVSILPFFMTVFIVALIQASAIFDIDKLSVAFDITQAHQYFLLNLLYGTLLTMGCALGAVFGWFLNPLVCLLTFRYSFAQCVKVFFHLKFPEHWLKVTDVSPLSAAEKALLVRFENSLFLNHKYVFMLLMILGFSLSQAIVFSIFLTKEQGISYYRFIAVLAFMLPMAFLMAITVREMLLYKYEALLRRDSIQQNDG